MFAVQFTAAAANTLDRMAGFLDPDVKLLHQNHGSLLRSIFSLYMAICGGRSWGEFVWPLLLTNKVYVCLFILYVTLAILTLMNVVTGIFVQGAMAKAQGEKETRIQHELESKKILAREIAEVFCAIDVDQSGVITAEELEEFLNDPRMSAHFDALEL